MNTTGMMRLHLGMCRRFEWVYGGRSGLVGARGSHQGQEEREVGITKGREQRTENREQRRENREQRTEKVRELGALSRFGFLIFFF